MSALPIAGGGQIIWLGRRLEAPGFTARDRAELVRWASDPDREVAWENDPTEFAMLYQGSVSWALWAVARQDGRLVVWDCVTFADIGHFDCMVDALAALCGSASGHDAAASNVLSFVDARRRRIDEAENAALPA